MHELKRRIEALRAKMARNLSPQEQDELTRLLQQPVTILSGPEWTLAQVIETLKEPFGFAELTAKLQKFSVEAEDLKRAGELLRKVVAGKS